MSQTPDNIANCRSCECAMDVTMLAPFTNVQCPECGEHNRVKVDVGGYVLRKRQGIGGMSLVFGAVDKTLRRTVDIKILNEEYSMDEKRIQQFEQEARITAAMSHPHIVKVYTVGQAFDRFFIAMEMVGGDSLEQMMREHGSLPESEVLGWAQQVADGLNAANEAGLIHRDIKPGNLLFDKEGHVKIVDFGLALVTQGGKAQADEIWATPYYVPPEALDIGEEDFRSDIYALGASLFHALSGEPPFSTETRSTTELKEIKRNLRSLKEAAPWLNDETCAVIDRAMAFKMDDRFSSYKELVDAFHYAQMTVMDDGARPAVSSAKRAQKRNAVSGWKLYAGIAAAVVVIGGGIAAMVMNSSEKAKPTTVDDGGHSKPIHTNSGESGVLSKRVGVEILAARSSLLYRNYSDASRRYGKLAGDPKVSANTVCWASIQSANSSWLDGRSGDARRQLLNTLKRYSGASRQPSTDVADRMMSGIRQLTEFGKINPLDLPALKDETSAMIYFAAGLKNWNSGAPKEACKLFDRLQSLKFEPSEELAFYIKRADDYLKDEQLLDSLRDGYYPKAVAELDERMGLIAKVEKVIKTRGRARFDLEEWKYQVKMHRLRLAREKKELIAKAQENKANPTKTDVDDRDEWEVVFDEVKNDLLNAEFAKPLARLQLEDFVDETFNQRKNQLIYLCEKADGYKGTLRHTFANRRFSAELMLKNGKKASQVTGASFKGLILVVNGSSKHAAWAEIEPGSLVDLHGLNVQGDISQFEKNLRLEQAVAFAFLTGETHKAKKGANSLAKVNPLFRNRWKSCLELLGD